MTTNGRSSPLCSLCDDSAAQRVGALLRLRLLTTGTHSRLTRHKGGTVNADARRDQNDVIE